MKLKDQPDKMQEIMDKDQKEIIPLPILIKGIKASKKIISESNTMIPSPN
jgi:hypothetical protein